MSYDPPIAAGQSGEDQKMISRHRVPSNSAHKHGCRCSPAKTTRDYLEAFSLSRSEIPARKVNDLCKRLALLQGEQCTQNVTGEPRRFEIIGRMDMRNSSGTPLSLGPVQAAGLSTWRSSVENLKQQVLRSDGEWFAPSELRMTNLKTTYVRHS